MHAVSLVALTWLAAPAPQAETLAPTYSRPSADAGFSLSVSGDLAAVGAPDYLGYGAVFPYHHDGTQWVEEPPVIAPTQSLDFGESVSLWGDLLAVGAPRSGSTGESSAFVYRRVGSSWLLEDSVPASVLPNGFGSAVAIEGDRLVVGSRFEFGEGAAYVFERSGLDWIYQARLVQDAPSNNVWFGHAVALSGDTVLIGAPGPEFNLNHRGTAYVFVGGGTSWVQQARLLPSIGNTTDYFGTAVVLQGDEALVGADGFDQFFQSGAVFEFVRSGTSWSETQMLTSPGYQFFGASLARSGDVLAVGAVNQGFTGGTNPRVFVRSGGGWEERGSFAPPLSMFPAFMGVSVALHGNQLLTGAPEADLGPVVHDAQGLAFDTAGSRLFTTGETGKLVELAEFPNSVEYRSFGKADAMAYDPATGLLWGVQFVATKWMHPVTGATGQAGLVGFAAVRGMAHDPNTGKLWGADDGSDQLIVIDKSTGTGAAVGPLGFDGVHGLAYDPIQGVLYATDGQTLFTVDPGTGAGTPVGAIGFTGVHALAFDPVAGELLGTHSEVFGFSQLIEIDPATGAGTPRLHIYARKSGAVFVFDIDATQTYCTAGVSSAGCQAVIAASGAPSASAASGFDLSASLAEGAKNGLFFFGTSGRQANPWGNGTSLQCVVPPVSRGSLLIGTGTGGSCDGGFAEDLNALWCPTCPKPQKNPGAGAVVQAQLWYRDPASTSNQTTSLSDAIEFLVGL